MRSNSNVVRAKLLILYLTLALSFLISCNKPPSPPAELKVGVFVYNRDKAQTCCGEATFNIVNMIEKEVEEAGGIIVGGKRVALRISTVGIDNNPEEAVNAAEHLINQKGVHVLIGPQHSGDAIPVAEIAQSSGILMISPMSTNPGTTAGKDHVFRIGFLDDFQGEVLATFAYRNLAVRRAAILYDISRPYNRGIAERFSSRFTLFGGTVVASQTYLSGQEEFSSQLAAIREADPELILLPNHNNDVLIQGPQIRDQGLNVILLGTDAWDELQLASIPGFDNAYKVSHWSETVDSEANRKFVKEYKTLFGEAPNNTAALTYDAFQILFQAAAAAGSTEPADLVKALYELPPYPGLSGLIDYPVSGDPAKSAVVLQLSRGKITFVKMYQP
ncbi:MAG: ABC transporter substrate-binding protein [bacterium]|nr:ABC transporter substrate-binding protein [bacterium]MDT8365124.1 ABC transporter substrate-binding protein [bacterium]